MNHGIISVTSSKEVWGFLPNFFCLIHEGAHDVNLCATYYIKEYNLLALDIVNTLFKL